jgi:indolepyruvate ferredoxin oxidoreductase, beta subunit
MKEKINITLTGVGGQGVVTAANILGVTAVRAGINVFVSEVHGMAQRGGSVNCTVRLGDVSGPLIPNGSANVVLSMEPSEALRYIQYTNKKTKIITDIVPVIPFTVATGDEKYPELEKIFNELEKYGELYKVDAAKLAKEAGALISKNVVMLGALAGADILPFKSDILLETILENVPKKYMDINKKAFELGFKSIKK